MNQAVYAHAHVIIDAVETERASERKHLLVLLAMTPVFVFVAARPAWQAAQSQLVLVRFQH